MVEGQQEQVPVVVYVNHGARCLRITTATGWYMGEYFTKFLRISLGYNFLDFCGGVELMEIMTEIFSRKPEKKGGGNNFKVG